MNNFIDPNSWGSNEISKTAVVVCSSNLNQNKVMMNVLPEEKAKVRSDIQEDGDPIVFLLTQV